MANMNSQVWSLLIAIYLIIKPADKPKVLLDLEAKQKE
jgi:hypothetical protein